MLEAFFVRDFERLINFGNRIIEHWRDRQARFNYSAACVFRGCTDETFAPCLRMIFRRYDISFLRSLLRDMRLVMHF